MVLRVSLVVAIVLISLSEDVFGVAINVTCDVGQKFDPEVMLCRSDCAPGQVYNFETKTCIGRKKVRPRCKNVTLDEEQYEFLDNGHVYVPDLNVTIPSDMVTITPDNKMVFCHNYSSTFMTCSRWMLDSHEIELQNNGLKVWIPGYNTMYNTEDFYLVPDSEGQMGAVVCIRKGSREANAKRETVLRVYCAAWIISEICLVLAFILCLTLPQFSFMYHILPFYIGSLFVAYLILILRSTILNASPSTCYFFAVTLQFFFLAAFFWLNVLAFDIWRTLVKRQWYLEAFNRHTHRLIGFSAYAFGIPFIIVLITVLIDLYQVGHKSIQPHFHQHCWFKHDLSKLSFFYGPVAVILFINVVFFILTLLGLRSDDKRLFRDSMEKKHLWRTTLELAVLMGLCWTMEVVSWAVKADSSVWYFTDVINGLQGFFILIVILTKPKVFRSIWEWLRNHMPCTKT